MKIFYSYLSVSAIAASLVLGSGSIAHSQTEDPPTVREAEVETETSPSCLARLPGGYCLSIFPIVSEEGTPTALVNVQVPGGDTTGETTTGAVNIINVFVMPPATPVSESPPLEIEPLEEADVVPPSIDDRNPLW